MGSSAKRKKEKKKDFQKAKLRVGKTAPKADNATSTSFKAKSIVLKQQSLTTAAPSQTASFIHTLSLLTSKSESQRRDALSSLANTISGTPPSAQLPQPIAIILPKLEPLVLDASQSVRAQYLRCLGALGTYDRARRNVEEGSAIATRVKNLLLYTIAALNHLSGSVRGTGLDVLVWLLQTAPEEVVGSKGGLSQPLKTLLGMLGWNTSQGVKGSGSGWSIAKPTSASNPSAADIKTKVKTMNTLALLLETALQPPTKDTSAVDPAVQWFPLRHTWVHIHPPKIGDYDDMELFVPANRQSGKGSEAEEGNERLGNYEERREWFERYREAVVKGVDEARKEGGEVGRAAKGVEKAFKME